MTSQPPLAVQDRIPWFVFVFSASFFLSLWSILSANPFKSFPKWHVITSHFLSLPFLTQATLPSHLVHPKTFLTSPCWPFPHLSSHPTCPRAISQILKVHWVFSLPWLGHLNGFPVHLEALSVAYQAPHYLTFPPSLKAMLLTYCVLDLCLLPDPPNTFLPQNLLHVALLPKCFLLPSSHAGF